MVSYQDTRLARTGAVSGREKRRVQSALGKPSCSTPSERLIVRVECFLPDWLRKKRNKKDAEEATAKLVRQLVKGPLSHCESDEERDKEADRFLQSKEPLEGTNWVDSWFLPGELGKGASRRSSATRAPLSGEAVRVADSNHSSIPVEIIVDGKLTDSHENVPSPMDVSAGAHVGSEAAAFPVATSPVAASRVALLTPTSSHRALLPNAQTIEAWQMADPTYRGEGPPVAFRFHGDALCVRCWGIHSTAIGGPFLLWFPFRQGDDDAQDNAEEDADSCRLRRNILISTAICFIAWFLIACSSISSLGLRF